MLCMGLLLAPLYAATTLSWAKKDKGKKDPEKRFYALKCAGSCHRIYKPHEYTAEQWREILPDMAKRAKLTEAEAKRIEAYLLKNSKSIDD